MNALLNFANTAQLAYGGALPAAPQDPRWLNNPVITQMLWPETLHTLGTTFGSMLFTLIFGIPLGMLLVSTAKGGLLQNRPVYQILSFVVNIARSIPFIILMIMLIGFIRLIVGTALGWQAAIVPLTIGAVPFYARLVETAVMGVENGKVEAAQMMGASRLQIMGGVQLREALPALIQNTTTTIITLLGFSAIAGTTGGEGLGMLVYNYGYSQFQDDVTMAVVLVIIVLVTIIQMCGDMLSRLVDHR